MTPSKTITPLKQGGSDYWKKYQNRQWKEYRNQQWNDYTTHTPITQEDWRNLKKNDGIYDAHGDRWEITRRDPDGNPDRLFALTPGHIPFEAPLDWCGRKIFTEGLDLSELNNPSVELEIKD